MSTELWWNDNDRATPKHTETNLLECQFFHSIVN